MKNLKCVICGRDIKAGKTKRRFCLACLELKARIKRRMKANRRFSRL